MKRQSFTLIELTVVIVIVAVIASLALTSYMKVMHAQEFSRILVDLKTFKSIFDIYYARHGKESLPGWSPMPADDFFSKPQFTDIHSYPAAPPGYAYYLECTCDYYAVTIITGDPALGSSYLGQWGEQDQGTAVEWFEVYMSHPLAQHFYDFLVKSGENPIQH